MSVSVAGRLAFRQTGGGSGGCRILAEFALKLHIERQDLGERGLPMSAAKCKRTKEPAWRTPTHDAAPLFWRSAYPAQPAYVFLPFPSTHFQFKGRMRESDKRQPAALFVCAVAVRNTGSDQSINQRRPYREGRSSPSMWTRGGGASASDRPQQRNKGVSHSCGG